tara:strand:- start:202 stop:639 length:438 start_codon:yes stop_codon:yes gene_type:complete
MAKLIQKHELEQEDSIACPERDLWIAVLARASLDAFRGPPQLNMGLKANRTHKNIYTYDRDQARSFFLQGGSHFNEVCEMAGRNPIYVKEKARKLLLRKNGWNVDVPITSHYRQGPKRNRGRPKTKHLTGNAYYAAKAAQYGGTP